MHLDAQHRRFAAPTTPHQSRNASLTVFGDYIDRLFSDSRGDSEVPDFTHVRIADINDTDILLENEVAK